MKTSYVIGLTLLAGVALGASAIQGLHAQAKPPVYVVVDVGEVTDPAGWATITERIQQAVEAISKDFGGRYLARAGAITALDGTPPKRTIIIAFDNAEKAQAWYNLPDQKKVNEARMKSSKSRAFIVEGM